jgi:hypothetical protein
MRFPTTSVFHTENREADFRGQNAEAPPYPPSKFLSISAPSFSSVTASPFVGFAPLSYSRSAFFGGYPSLLTRLWMSPSSRLPAAADVERTHNEDFHPDSNLCFGPNPT